VDVLEGHVLTKDDFVYKRPGTGIRPGEIKYIIGRKFKEDTKKDKTLMLSDFI
jgi:N-acetylneuraminate synthase